MNLRKHVYFALVSSRGQALGTNYGRFLRETQEGIPTDTSRNLLIQLLTHCKHSVPYYSKIMSTKNDSFEENPKEYLKDFPIMTKDIIRNHFEDLKSKDLQKRKQYFNTSGGSTGEPVRFIQDWDYAARMGAIKLLYSKLAGREIGEPEVLLWGSPHEITEYSESKKAVFVDKLTNTLMLNAFKMTRENMHEYVRVMNKRRPKQIVAYADSIYKLANFAESEGLDVLPQQSIITSAGMLYPTMREKIEKVFQCRVFNRYGSREVGDIACERPGYDGLWVAPWGNYLEVVDKQGNRVPDGSEGEILVTSLMNYAMPLIRYRIGDIGVLAHNGEVERDSGIQILKSILGRTVDNFITKDGTLIHAGNFMIILFYRDWILRYQAIQKSYSHIIYRIVRLGPEPPPAELNDIVNKTRKVMGDDCKVTFEFVDEILASSSGKYRYIICEIMD